MTAQQQLSEAGRISGHIERSAFIPNSYTQRQRDAVQSFFSQNGYIGIS